MSPGLASPSSPSEQLIFPLSGAVSGGHVGTIVKDILFAVKAFYLDNTFLQIFVDLVLLTMHNRLFSLLLCFLPNSTQLLTGHGLLYLTSHSNYI